MDEIKSLSYFSSINHICKKVAIQEKSLIKYLGNKWTEYTPQQQEQLLDDLCVPHSFRKEQPPVADDDEGSKVLSCWPTLKLPSGEKIIVDETDIWTWKDEHSGPFSWKSKSQQDLTLLDLEPENLTKPYIKNHKSDADHFSTVCPKYQFQLNPDFWTKDIVEDYLLHGCTKFQTPLHTPSAATASPSSNPSEEINPAYKDSCEDVSSSSSPKKLQSLTSPLKSPNQDSVQIFETVIETQRPKSKEHKSPSPKKILQTSNSKKEIKSKSHDDTGHQKLISDAGKEKKNAFSNPALEDEWSNFVGEDTKAPNLKVDNMSSVIDTQTSSASNIANPPVSTSKKPLPSVEDEPVDMVIDRGSNSKNGNASFESTPDHTTQLLRPISAEVLEAEKEEVLYVIGNTTEGYTLSSELTTSSSSLNIPRTGFGFLDDW